MDLRKLKALIELVQTSGISELEITEGEERVRINRGGMTGMQPMMMQPMAAPAPMSVMTAAATPEAAPVEEGHVVTTCGWTPPTASASSRATRLRWPRWPLAGC